MAEGRNLREKKIEIWRKPIEEEFSFENLNLFMEGNIFEKYKYSLVHHIFKLFFSVEES